MVVARRDILALLADGKFHSGEDLATRLGVSRAAIWKHIDALSELGLDVHRVHGRGYRLAEPLTLLDENEIRAHCTSAAQWQLTILDSVDSTNRFLREAKEPRMICLAEHQSSGRGRRGRDWQSPYGRNIYLSLSWEFKELPAAVGALGLAVAVMCVRGLEAMGLRGVGIKWPNDLVTADGKLGGILLEMDGEPAGPCRLVIGVGINLQLPATVKSALDQAATDIQEAGLRDANRNVVVGRLLLELIDGMHAFERSGFAGFRAEYDQHDQLQGKEVDIHEEAGQRRGTVHGVNDDGSLRVATAQGDENVFSADVSVRTVA